MLLANKTDSNDQYFEDYQDRVRLFCQENYLLYQRISCKTGKNTQQSIQALVE